MAVRGGFPGRCASLGKAGRAALPPRRERTNAGLLASARSGAALARPGPGEGFGAARALTGCGPVSAQLRRVAVAGISGLHREANAAPTPSRLADSPGFGNKRFL